MDVDTPIKNINKKAYIFITTHGEYKFTQKKGGVPEIEEGLKFQLGKTGIQKLTWIRSVPGGVTNFCPEDKQIILDNFYEPYKERIKYLEDDAKMDILSETLKAFRKTAHNIEPAVKDKISFEYYLNTVHKHYKVHNFTTTDEILDKFYFLGPDDMPGDAQEDSNPDINPDFKIILFHYNSSNHSVNGEDITKILMTSPDEHGLTSTSLLILLWYLSKELGYTEVEILDLTCATALINDDMDTLLDKRTLRSIMKEVSKTGGKRKRTVKRRAKKKKSIKAYKSIRNKSYKARGKLPKSK
jgi:hypothetical protein